MAKIGTWMGAKLSPLAEISHNKTLQATMTSHAKKNWNIPERTIPVQPWWTYWDNLTYERMTSYFYKKHYRYGYR